MGRRKKRVFSGNPEIRFDLGLEEIPEDDRIDNNCEYPSHSAQGQDHDVHEESDDRNDDANDPDPGPGLETADPGKESDDAYDKENNSGSGSKVAGQQGSEMRLRGTRRLSIISRQ